MERIFHSHASKTDFHKKGCALGVILKGGVVESCTIMTSCLRKGFIAATSSLKFNVNLPKIVNNDLNQCLFCLP